MQFTTTSDIIFCYSLMIHSQTNDRAELTQAELTQAELTQAELTQAELTQAELKRLEDKLKDFHENMNEVLKLTEEKTKEQLEALKADTDELRDGQTQSVESILSIKKQLDVLEDKTAQLTDKLDADKQSNQLEFDRLGASDEELEGKLARLVEKQSEFKSDVDELKSALEDTNRTTCEKFSEQTKEHCELREKLEFSLKKQSDDLMLKNLELANSLEAAEDANKNKFDEQMTEYMKTKESIELSMRTEFCELTSKHEGLTDKLASIEMTMDERWDNHKDRDEEFAKKLDALVSTSLEYLTRNRADEEAEKERQEMIKCIKDSLTSVEGAMARMKKEKQNNEETSD